jgi:hypothetical protein
MIDPATLPPHVQQHGFWLVDDEIVFSKVKSILLAQQKNTSDIRYYYHDHVYSSVDWKVEPTQSLQQLYAERAKQLREKYDYIVLLYSGGSDSSNALKTFLNNNIKLDEVACWYTSYDEQNNPTNLEIIHAASGMLEKLHNEHDILVTKIDERPYFESINIKSDEWILSAEPNLTTAQLNKLKLLYGNKNWSNLADSGKSIGLIVGLEKPRIYYENGKWMAGFIDVVNAWNFEHWHTNRSHITLEPFYISPNFPSITVKQSHLVKNYINLTYSKEFIQKNFTNDGNYNQELYFKIVRNVVYPYWDDTTFSIGKDKPLLKEKYRWVWGNENDVSKNYLAGLKWLSDNVDDYFFNGENIFSGLLGCWSKRYNLDA